MRATVSESGQVTVPAWLRREMNLEPGQTVLWEKVSDTECRLIVVPKETSPPDPLSALGFARQHGLKECSTDAWLKELWADETHDAGEAD